MNTYFKQEIKSNMTNQELKLALIETYAYSDLLLQLCDQYEQLISIMNKTNYECNSDYELTKKNIAFLYKQLGYNGE